MHYSIITVLCLLSFALMAQDKQVRRLSKQEKIYQSAYDDTTRMLAELFVQKRSVIKRTQRNVLVGVAASAVVYGAGAMMALNNADSQTSSYEPEFYGGIGLMFVGAGGAIVFSTLSGMHAIRLSPYTLRKYYRVIDLYKTGKPIPEYYRSRLYLASQNMNKTKGR